jgi:hypothetical protein
MGSGRYVLAIGVIALTLAAALFVHQRHINIYTTSCSRDFGVKMCHRYIKVGNWHVHPSWEDPVAVFLAIGGIAAAVGVIGYRPTRPA